MKLFINSRRVDAYKLKIYADGKEIFCAYMFSNSKSEINIGLSDVSELRLEYDFRLSKAEIKMLEERNDCPKWGVAAYDILCMLTPGADAITDYECPVSMKGVYATVVDHIPENCDALHLMFRRSKLNQDMPLLYVMNRQERDMVAVHYRRIEPVCAKLEEARSIVRKSLVLDMLKILVLLLAVFLLELYFPKGYIIYPLIFIACYIGQGTLRHFRTMRKFFCTVEGLHGFKEVNGKIEKID